MNQNNPFFLEDLLFNPGQIIACHQNNYAVYFHTADKTCYARYFCLTEKTAGFTYRRPILGTKCVTCSYIDKFALFHNQMSVIHNIVVKFL